MLTEDIEIIVRKIVLINTHHAAPVLLLQVQSLIYHVHHDVLDMLLQQFEVFKLLNKDGTPCEFLISCECFYNRHDLINRGPMSKIGKLITYLNGSYERVQFGLIGEILKEQR